MKIAMALVAALALGAPAVTLTGDRALIIPAQDIKSQLDALVPQARPTGSTGPIVASYGNLGLMLSVRTANGMGELHQHADDLMVVEEGSATIITGGSLVAPKTIGVGDVIIVPAGVPHQILIPSGTVYKSLVAKIKE